VELGKLPVGRGIPVNRGSWKLTQSLLENVETTASWKAGNSTQTTSSTPSDAYLSTGIYPR
jgi:hypothetical protein